MLNPVFRRAGCRFFPLAAEERQVNLLNKLLHCWLASRRYGPGTTIDLAHEILALLVGGAFVHLRSPAEREIFPFAFSVVVKDHPYSPFSMLAKLQASFLKSPASH